MQNNALRICYNVKLRDRVSVRRMRFRAYLLSLEQRRQIQLLCLMFIYKERHVDARRIYNRRTRAAGLYSFVRERYNCVKYRNSPYLLIIKAHLYAWDTLPVVVRNSTSLREFKNDLKTVYSEYKENLSRYGKVM